MDRLNAGEDFNEIVLDYSDDQGTVNRGGILPWFTANRLFPSFYDEVKDLQIGQYSQIIETQYGYHILKVMDRKEIGTFEENKESLKRKITKSDRADLSRESLIKKIKKEYSFSENKEEIYTLESILDNSVFLEGWKADKAAGMTNFLAQIGDKKYTVADFAKFIEETQIKDKPIAIKTFIEKKYDNFVEKICVDFEDGQLENKYQDFRILMQEYYDGILLFELKNELIWEKAIADTAGLEKFHAENKENYMWKERIEVYEFTMTDRSLTDKVLEVAQQEVAYDSIVKLVSAIGSRSVLTSHKTYEKGDDKFIDSFKWEEGITEVKDKDGKNVFLKIVKHMEPQPKKLNEAKGLITADYQDYLEKEWEEELREKYPVKINKKAFKRLRKK
jgi:peptidyl-prolyl cis-trans isomerase SurA